jgi:hypothetical protein
MGVAGRPSDAMSVGPGVRDGAAVSDVNVALGLVIVMAGAPAPAPAADVVVVVVVVMLVFVLVAEGVGPPPRDARFDVLPDEEGGTGLSSDASYARAMRSARGISSMSRRSKHEMLTSRASGSKVPSGGEGAAIVGCRGVAVCGSAVYGPDYGLLLLLLLS